MSKCTKFDFRWAPPHTPLGAYSAPPDLIAVFKGPTSKGTEGGREGEGREKVGYGKGGEGCPSPNWGIWIRQWLTRRAMTAVVDSAWETAITCATTRSSVSTTTKNDSSLPVSRHVTPTAAHLPPNITDFYHYSGVNLAGRGRGLTRLRMPIAPQQTSKPYQLQFCLDSAHTPLEEPASFRGGKRFKERGDKCREEEKWEGRKVKREE